jgi:hypothetical protein
MGTHRWLGRKRAHCHRLTSHAPLRASANTELEMSISMLLSSASINTSSNRTTGRCGADAFERPLAEPMGASAVVAPVAGVAVVAGVAAVAAAAEHAGPREGLSVQ